MAQKITTCHHVSGWNTTKDDVGIGFRQRLAQIRPDHTLHANK